MSTIVATKGGADANSYLSVVEADLLANADYMIYKTWDNITEDEKSILLITATKHIDSLNIKYGKLYENQALKFPVKTNLYDDGYSVAQMACLYQAVYLYENIEILKEAEIDKAVGITSKNVGGASTNKIGLNINSFVSPTVKNMLIRYLNVGVKLARS